MKMVFSIQGPRVLLAGAALGLGQGVLADDNLWEAVSSGKVDVSLRYRFEFVDDGQRPPPASAPALRDAYANTVRTAIGYNTGLFHGLGAYLQFEDVRVIGGELYNDGGSNGRTWRAVVVDPEGSELQQANLRFRGLPKTTIWLGRQNLEHRVAPLHRYAGTVPWRQNWQSMDGLRVQSDYLPALKVDYSYVWNVNRIFGEDHPTNSDFEMNSHLFKADYTRFSWGTFEPYLYLLDIEDAPGNERFSTRTWGLRFQGGRDMISAPVKIQYTLEYARQRDWAENPNDISVAYVLSEASAQFALRNPVLTALTLKAGYERLEGDGGVAAFQTPLGTNHAFQGWADRFLVTPGDGVIDLYGTLGATVWGANLQLAWHGYTSDQDAYDYGTELDLQLTRVFAEHYTFGVKFAAYHADRNALNLARNSGGRQAFDLSKFWFWAEIRF